MANNQIKASQLVFSSEFKIGNQRKFRTVRRVLIFRDREGMPEQHRGKILIVLSNCRQIVLSPDDQVEIKKVITLPEGTCSACSTPGEKETAINEMATLYKKESES